MNKSIDLSKNKKKSLNYFESLFAIMIVRTEKQFNWENIVISDL
jgi:hypothetical protein